MHFCATLLVMFHRFGQMTGTLNVPSWPSTPRVPSLSCDINIEVQLDFLSTFLSSTLDRHKTATKRCNCVAGNILHHKLPLTERSQAAAGRLQGALIWTQLHSAAKTGRNVPFYSKEAKQPCFKCRLWSVRTSLEGEVWFGGLWDLPHLLLTGQLSNVLLVQESSQGSRLLPTQT